MPFQTLGKVTLYFRESGVPRTPRVVFLNSLGTDCRIWDDLAEALNGVTTCCNTISAGKGCPTHPKDRIPSGITRMTFELALVDSMGPDRAVRPLDRRNDRDRGVLASAGAGSRARALGHLGRDRHPCLLGSPYAGGAGRGFGAIAEPVMKRWFGTSFFDEHPYDAEGWANLLNRAPVEGYLGSCAALRDGDLSDRLGRISVPTYCVCGSEDTSTTPAEVRSLSERIRGSAFVEVDEAGHLVPLERPHEFAFVLNEFMEERLES